MAPDAAAALRGLRVRLTVTAAAAVFVVLSIAGTGLVITQRRALTDALRSRLRVRVNDLASAPPNTSVIASPGGEDTFVQVLALDGSVAAWSAGTPLRPLLPRAVDVRDGFHTHHLSFDNDTYLFYVRHTRTDVVIAAGSLGIVGDASSALRRWLLVFVPGVTLVLVALSWRLIGQTLEPVRELAQRQARFVADAAHELRTPLARMRAELEVDIAAPGTADLTATHRSALEEVATLQTLIDDLLVLARADGSRASRAPVRLRVLADDVVAALAPSRVAVRVEGHGAAVVGDAQALRRVIANLVDNAVRHAKDEVVVAVDGSGLSVSDDGPGVPEAQRDRIFERFGRADESRRAGDGGAGLGLSIARAIAEAHGGTLTLADDVRGGACFVLKLPAVSEESGK